MTTMLQQLADLRRLRAERAFERLTARDQELREAERLAAAAAQAVVDHVEETRAKERSLLAGLAGRTVSAAAILAVGAELDAAAHQTAQRQQAVDRARAEVDTRADARARSLKEFQGRERARQKLDFANDAALARQARLEAESDGDAEGAGTPS